MILGERGGIRRQTGNLERVAEHREFLGAVHMRSSTMLDGTGESLT
jgi:hypothetical protein